MMGLYLDDRPWSDRFLPQVRAIVGPLVLVEAPADEDKKRATDLMSIVKRIAVRIRKPGYSDRYKYQFTIRAKRDTGAITELSKIIAGWGDWMFYGHSDSDERVIALWWLIDLKCWRYERELVKSEDRENGDGTYLKAFDVRHFSPSILIASSLCEPDLAIEWRKQFEYISGETPTSWRTM
jgi:hypothetical protein